MPTTSARDIGTRIEPNSINFPLQISASVTNAPAVMFAYKAFEEMDGKDRVRSCYQHCVLRYVTNQRMTNQSLRERFKLPESKVETASRIIGDAIQQGKIKADDTNTSTRYAKYVPWWA